MFVFRGPFGCILHTGDFRWESGSVRLDSMKQCLATAIGGSRVALVHLDNTFCSPYISFPTRQIAAQQVPSMLFKYFSFKFYVIYLVAMMHFLGA